MVFFLHRPFRAIILLDISTQGVALGYAVAALQAEIPSRIHGEADG
jgi:hypothetical protein